MSNSVRLVLVGKFGVLELSACHIYDHPMSPFDHSILFRGVCSCYRRDNPLILKLFQDTEELKSSIAINRPDRLTGLAFETLDESQQELRRFFLGPQRTNLCEPTELFNH